MQRPATLATEAGRDFKLEAASLCGLNKCQANEQNKTKLPEKQGERKRGGKGMGREGTSKEETDLTDLIVSMQQKCANPKTARERERIRDAPHQSAGSSPSLSLLSTIPATVSCHCWHCHCLRFFSCSSQGASWACAA